MRGWMNERWDGYEDEWIWTDKWMDGWMNGWTGGWMDGWRE